MTDSLCFNITQSSKLADYLKMYDTIAAKKSPIVQSSNDKKRKITVENESNKRPYTQNKRENRQVYPGTKKPVFNDKNKINISNRKEDKLNVDERSDRLKNQMVEKLMHSQFRNVNQYLYENPTVQAIRYMTPDLFRKYHESYAQLVDKWPVNPLNVIISEIKRLTPFNARLLTIADLGCGEARLAKHFKEIESKTVVHSFDLVDLNEFITKASMDNVPLEDRTCDLVVFCLSLMPTNVRDCIIEANRILKKNGLLYIAEVVSRFDDNRFKVFISAMEQFGFKLIKQAILQPDDYFVLFRLKKTSPIEKLKGLPGIHLKPCKYKTR